MNATEKSKSIIFTDFASKLFTLTFQTRNSLVQLSLLVPPSQVNFERILNNFGRKSSNRSCYKSDGHQSPEGVSPEYFLLELTISMKIDQSSALLLDIYIKLIWIILNSYPDMKSVPIFALSEQNLHTKTSLHHHKRLFRREVFFFRISARYST